MTDYLDKKKVSYYKHGLIKKIHLSNIWQRKHYQYLLEFVRQGLSFNRMIFLFHTNKFWTKMMGFEISISDIQKCVITAGYIPYNCSISLRIRCNPVIQYKSFPLRFFFLLGRITLKNKIFIFFFNLNISLPLVFCTVVLLRIDSSNEIYSDIFYCFQAYLILCS